MKLNSIKMFKSFKFILIEFHFQNTNFKSNLIYEILNDFIKLKKEGL